VTHIAFLTMISIVEWGKEGGEFKMGWSSGTSTVTGRQNAIGESLKN